MQSAIPAPGDDVLEYRANSRLGIIRKVAIYAPSGIVLTVLLVIAITALPASIVGVILLGIGCLAVDVEAIQGILDLVSKPVTTRGRVERSWSKGRFLFFGRVHYLLAATRPVVDGAVDEDQKGSRRLFEVGPVAAGELEPGDVIEVTHWPHTNTLISLRKVR